jgi:hypothetical protein
MVIAMPEDGRDGRLPGGLRRVLAAPRGEEADVGLTACRILGLLEETEGRKLRYRELLQQCVEYGWLPDDSEASRAALSAMLRDIPTVKSLGGRVVLRPYPVGRDGAVFGHARGIVDMDQLAHGLHLLLEAMGYRVIGGTGTHGRPGGRRREP